MINIINYSKIGTLGLLFLLFFIKASYIPYVVVLYLVLSLLSINFKIINFRNEKGFWFIIILFILSAFSLFYSQNFNEGFSIVQTQLSLVIFPLLIITDKDLFKNRKKIHDLFILVSLTSIIILSFTFIYSGRLVKSFELSNGTDIFSMFRYLKLSFEQHPSYISLGYLLSLIFILKSFNKKERFFLSFLKVLSILLILIFIFFLNSRAALLTIVVVILYYTLKYLVEFRIIYKLIALIIILFCFFFIFSNSRFKENFIKLNSATTIEQIDIRFSLWKDAFIVWKEKPLFGHGIGDTQEAIVKVHQERNIVEAVESKLNAHNQFLETAMQTGLVGLIVLLLVFAIPLYQSIKKKQELLFLFLMICFINFLFESMLQRLAGVVFFAFWYSFLWFVYYKDDEKKELV